MTIDNADVLHGYDEVQVQLMEEKCIVVNKKDEVLGFESKKECE